MRRIRWAPAAAADLKGHRDYLQEHHPSLAYSTTRRLYEAARSLKQFPDRGRVGRKEGTRELVLVPLPYIVVYAVEPGMVHVLRVIHTSQDWPAA